MAESLVSHVVSQLTNLLIQEAASLGGVRQQIEWVETQLHLLRGFLKDADSRRKRGDARMESWITGMRGVAYEMEDIIDTIMYMAERRRQRRGCMGSISRYSHKPCELITLRKIRSRIEQIKIQIQTICQSTVSYALANPGQASAGDESWHLLRESSPHSDDDDSDVIGFEDDKKELMIQLLDASEKTRCVISIVGMGGLGKTTLARKVYNDPAIRQHFDTIGWVSVSQSYRGIELLKDIIKEVMGRSTAEDREQMDEEELREKLRNFLRDKKYLVVMDDVWTVDVWRKMQRAFPDEAYGSRILLTTRNIEVARHAESCFPPHELQLLNDAKSLELFRRKAFPPNQDVPTELEALAQKLAKRCGGLPLALVVLGGLLSRKDRSYDTWLKVAQSMNWESSGDGQECLRILGLSYNDLPYPLKPCFLYIAAFPDGSVISASKLVMLWIAEGFIVQEQRQTMEDTARDWLDELVQRCMIQVVQRSMADHDRFLRIRIHDMLRELGQSEARNDGFLHVCSSDDMAGSTTRISSHRAAFHNRMQDELVVSSPHLRTLLGFDLVLTNGGRFLNRLNLLRVLDLEDVQDLKELPKEIGSMIHLRYLGLERTGLKSMPSSIRHLLNLQTLDARGSKILWLPKSFWKIRTLRHVCINANMLLTAPISGDHKNLRTLEIWGFQLLDMDFMNMVRSLGARFTKNWVSAPGFTKEAFEKACERMFAESLGKALEKMNSLVSLTVYLNRQKIPRDVLFGRAPNLHQLRALRLWGPLLLKQQQQLPDSSQFPPNLTKLELINSKLEQDPMPILEKLSNLRLLTLYGDVYGGKSISCSSGGFPRLQNLTLADLDNLEEWRVEVGAMPILTYLTIRGCHELKIIPEGLQHVTTLRELWLSDMPHEFNNSARNEDGYMVRHKPPNIVYGHKLDET